MSALLTFLLFAAASGPDQAAVPEPPNDWSALPRPSFRRKLRFDYHLTDFVMREHSAGRCEVPFVRPGWRKITVDLAVLVAPDGRILQVVPGNVGCPTVERYSVRTIERLFKGKVRGPAGGAPEWYRTELHYSWGG